MTGDVDEADLDMRLRLTALTPDASRADRVRRRCRAELARRAHRARHVRARPAPMSGMLVPALLGLLAVLYAAALFSTTLRLESVLN